MSTIHISLTPKLEEFIQELLDTGLYSNVSEIIREALREKIGTHNSDLLKIHKLNQLIQVGLDQSDKGQFSSLSVEDIYKKVKNKAQIGV
jgi:antitoxin ParD1/3/4